MPELERTPSFDAARNRLENLVREISDDIGPHRLDEDGDDTEELIPNVMLSQWCLVAAWIDPVDGECYITRCNPHAPVYQINGLLQEALDGFGE
jgi:hypothetical protein